MILHAENRQIFMKQSFACAVIQIQMGYFNISVLIHNAISLMDQTLKNHGIMVETVLKYDSNLLTYRNEILQVLMALLKNSLDAFVEKQITNGEISITLDKDINYCIIKIRDNAGGIASEVINKLFIPYFTTKTKSNATKVFIYFNLYRIPLGNIVVDEHQHKNKNETRERHDRYRDVTEFQDIYF